MDEVEETQALEDTERQDSTAATNAAETVETSEDEEILEETVAEVDALASAMVALLTRMDDAAADEATVVEESECADELPATSQWVAGEPLRRHTSLSELELEDAREPQATEDGHDGPISPSAVGKVLLSPLQMELPGLKTLGDFCQVSGAKYAKLRLQHSCRRVGFLRRLADRDIDTVPESPCASRFSSFTSSTKSDAKSEASSVKELILGSFKSSGSLKAVREAARDAAASWESVFTGKALPRSP